MKSRSLLTFLFVCAAVSAPAADKFTFPKDLPAYGKTSAAAPPRIIETKVENGLTVWLVPIKGLPKVAFTLAVNGGNDSDPADLPGMADLLAEAVTDGTQSRTARQIAEQIQLAGGDLNSSATIDGILVETEVLANGSPVALDLLADVARNASFPQNEVEIIKKNAQSNLEGNEASPSFLGRRALYGALFAGHPYAVTSPTRESIAKITPALLKQEYERRFRPDQALLVAVGDFDEARVQSQIRSSFGNWRAPLQPPAARPAAPTGNITKTVVYVPRENSVQTAFYLGAVMPKRADSDYEAVRVANAIYGGMFGSRLVLNIREDKGYTYSPGARLQSLRAAGVLITRADVRNEVTGASFNEISYELNRVATTPVGDEELGQAKRYVAGSLALQLQSRSSVARSLADNWWSGLPAGSAWTEGDAIENVKAKDVNEAGRKYFPFSRMTVVAVGDENVIKRQLALFGLEFKKSQ
jgi:predicted Zn-dependent peptidase